MNFVLLFLTESDFPEIFQLIIFFFTGSMFSNINYENTIKFYEFFLKKNYFPAHVHQVI